MSDNGLITLVLLAEALMAMLAIGLLSRKPPRS